MTASAITHISALSLADFKAYLIPDINVPR